MADGKVDTKTCNSKRFILAGLGGTLATTIVVIIISLALSPADVSFSVSHASSYVSINGSMIKMKLALTVAASNPSRRCRANYRSIFVDVKKTFFNVKKGTDSTGDQRVIIFDLPYTTFPTGYIKGPNATLMNASATLRLPTDYVTDEASSISDWLKNMTAVVRAVVRFKIGVIPTRLYEIKVSCPRVSFPEEGSSASAQQGDYECSG